MGDGLSGEVCVEKSQDNSETGEEMYFKVKLADVVIGIHGQYDYLKEYCKDYLTLEDAEVEICLKKEDILEESSRVENEAFSMPYLETLAALRKIAEQMPQRNRFLMHGAVLSWHGQGYMFTAPSGTGKSTHLALWKKYLGEEVEIVNGDKPLISVENEEIRVYGTPWGGKERWQRNISVPLRGICFLRRGIANRIREVQSGEALPMLMQQVYYTRNPESAGKTMELLDEVFKKVPMYKMECDISKEAVECSFGMMVMK